MTQSKKIRDRKGEVFIQSRRLVARSSPEADESLYGWTVRLADANGYANAKAILSLVVASAESSQDPLGNRLAQLVDGSLNHFGKYVALGASASLCHSLELGLATQYFDIRPKVCPACLAERANRARSQRIPNNILTQPGIGPTIKGHTARGISRIWPHRSLPEFLWIFMSGKAGR
jgi:hypothetical protein